MQRIILTWISPQNCHRFNYAYKDTKVKVCISDCNTNLVDIATEGVRGVMVIIVGDGYGDTSSNPAQNSLHFT